MNLLDGVSVAFVRKHLKVSAGKSSQSYSQELMRDSVIPSSFSRSVTFSSGYRLYFATVHRYNIVLNAVLNTVFTAIMLR